MIRLLAIDPGDVVSGWVLMGDGPMEVRGSGITPNQEVLEMCKTHRGLLAIERVAAMGMIVGESIFATVEWSGRFRQAYAYPEEVIRIKRTAIKIHVCGTSASTDANVRQALLDLFGPKGTKAEPGPTYGFSKDKWAALALAATVRELT